MKTTLDPFYLETAKTEILISCPSCSDCAWIRSIAYLGSERKFVAKCFCSRCAKTWQFEPGGYGPNDSKPYLYMPLRLQTRCCGEVLWAFNKKHLDLLELYVSQTLRKRPLNFKGSLQSRLPRWILSARIAKQSFAELND